MPFPGTRRPIRSSTGPILAGVLFLAVLCPRPSWGLTTNTAASFLCVDAGSRPAALAGAYTALADDGFSLIYNPAGLHHVDSLVLSVQHNEWGLEMRQEFVGAALPAGPGTLGVGIGYLTYGSIPQRDGTGARTGDSLMPADLDLIAGYGLGGLGPGGAVGASFHLVREDLAGEGKIGLAASLGGQYAWPRSGLRLGAALRNLGPAFEGFSLPTLATLGAAYAVVPGVLKLGVQTDLPLASGSLVLSGAAELTLARRVALRAGYRAAPADGANGLHGFTAGLGVDLAPVQVAYAYAPLGDVAQSHRVTLEYAFAAGSTGTAEPAPAAPVLFPTPTPEVGLLPSKELSLQPSTQTLNQRLATTPEEMQEAKETLQRGQAYAQRRQYDLAIEEYVKALALDPELTPARRALSLAKRDRARQLLAGIRQSSTAKETSEEAKRLHQQGLELERKGKVVDAAFAFKSALLLNPGNEAVQRDLTRVQQEAGRARAGGKGVRGETPGEAAQLIKKAPSGRLNASEETIPALPARRPARSGGAEGDDSQTRAIQKHFLLGSQALDSGEYEQAIREFELILEFEPSNKQAQYKLNLARTRSAEEKEAAKARVQYAQAKGDRLGEMKELRTLLLMNPRDAAARKAFNEAKKKSTAQIEELYKKGVIAYAQGNYNEAIQVWNEVLDLEPNHVKAKESIKRAREKLELTNE